MIMVFISFVMLSILLTGCIKKPLNSVSSVMSDFSSDISIGQMSSMNSQVTSALTSFKQGSGNASSSRNISQGNSDIDSEEPQYNPSTDKFYSRNVFFATWVMIWDGSTESWWKQSDSEGAKVNINGTWQSIDWNNDASLNSYFNSMKNAGINIIVLDFTNGFRWSKQAKTIQKLCSENNMKMCIAFNPQDGSNMESFSRTTWELYANPDASYSNAYFYKDGKPLVVLYTWRDGFNNSFKQTGEYRSKFNVVWASGEDSKVNKWGWQLEPQIGPMSSSDSMFITPSVKFEPKDDKWRKDLSWLDYGFLMTKKSNPKYVVVGSYDDLFERNGWMPMDTTNCKVAVQLKDIYGKISTTAYYNRVSEWIKNGKPMTVVGGLIKDGAYQVVASNGMTLSTANSATSFSLANLKANSNVIDNYIWFYHLGNNEYRIIKLNSAYSFEANSNGDMFINVARDDSAQRWSITKDNSGKYIFINKSNEKAMDFANTTVLTKTKDDSVASQKWLLTPIALIE